MLHTMLFISNIPESICTTNWRSITLQEPVFLYTFVTVPFEGNCTAYRYTRMSYISRLSQVRTRNPKCLGWNLHFFRLQHIQRDFGRSWFCDVNFFSFYSEKNFELSPLFPKLSFRQKNFVAKRRNNSCSKLAQMEPLFIFLPQPFMYYTCIGSVYRYIKWFFGAVKSIILFAR
jgi:hypothetical protein